MGWNRTYLSALAVLFFYSQAAAEDRPLDAATLRKVKAATVHLEVSPRDKPTKEGTGFFAGEPGLVITNAHVVGMSALDSTKPRRVDVTLTDSDGQTRTLKGEILGIDPGSDLALLRVEGEQLPTPLAMGDVKNLLETDTLYAFGFPFGKELGTEITVGRTTVTSLRRSGGVLHRIQVSGGLNPGNSGGPLVDHQGNVMGVAVSMIEGAGIAFAVPQNAVASFLNGRIYTSSAAPAYQDGETIKLPLTLELVDPLSRIERVDIEVWAGEPGPARNASRTEPKALPSDSPKKRYPMKLEKGVASLEVTLPELSGSQVHWTRPVLVNGKHETLWSVATPRKPSPPLDRRAITIRFVPSANSTEKVETTSQSQFRVHSEKGSENTLAMEFRTQTTESWLPSGDSYPMRLTYDRMGVALRINDSSAEDDSELQEALCDMAFLAGKLEFGAGGKVISAQPDLSRVPRESQQLMEFVSEGLLESLELLVVPCLDRKIEPLETWSVDRKLRIGSCILAIPAQGKLTYTYLGMYQDESGEGFALLNISGVVSRRPGDSAEIQGSLSGTARVAIHTGKVHSATLQMRAEAEKGGAKVEATSTLSVLRPATEESTLPALVRRQVPPESEQRPARVVVMPNLPFPMAPRPGVIYPQNPLPVAPYPGAPRVGIPYPNIPRPGVPYPGVPYPGVRYPGVPNPNVPYPGIPRPGVPRPGFR